MKPSVHITHPNLKVFGHRKWRYQETLCTIKMGSELSSALAVEYRYSTFLRVMLSKVMLTFRMVKGKNTHYPNIKKTVSGRGSSEVRGAKLLNRVFAKAEFTNPIPQKIRRTKKYYGIP